MTRTAAKTVAVEEDFSIAEERAVKVVFGPRETVVILQALPGRHVRGEKRKIVGYESPYRSLRVASYEIRCENREAIAFHGLKIGGATILDVDEVPLTDVDAFLRFLLGRKSYRVDLNWEKVPPRQDEKGWWVTDSTRASTSNIVTCLTNTSDVERDVTIAIRYEPMVP